jgi:choline dehydrogenase-like flavoprotein
MTYNITSVGTKNILLGVGASPNSESVVDYRALTNPLDIRIEVLLLKAIQSYFVREGEYIEAHPVEATPRPNVTTDADLVRYAQDTVILTQYHPLRACSKMPLELGGVVGEELKLHGIWQLSIVDASIIPLIIGGTTQATVHAVAGKVRRFLSKAKLSHTLKSKLKILLNRLK